MKKSLIALAVAGVFVAPAAMADTTIYGQANVSYDNVNNGSVTNNHVASNQSRIGFKGTEDLGGGTSAVWQIESGVDLDAGGNTLATRNTFAGLTGESWGTAILGKHDTPYKIATRGLDLFADTIADNRNIMGMTEVGGVSEDARLDNVAAYISPAMSGLTVAVATVAGSESFSNTASAPNNTRGSAWSLAALYGAGPLNASLAYQTVTVGSSGTGSLDLGLGLPAGVDAKVTAWKLGGSYTMDAIQVNAVYEKFSSSGADIHSADDRAAFYLGGKYSFGSDAVKLAYTSAGKVDSAADTEATQVSLGYDHSLSKNTTAYALYTKVTNKKHAAYGMGANIATSGFAGATDADPSAWSLGLKHSF